MTTALFVSTTKDEKTAELLRKIGADKVVYACSGGEARRIASSVDFDLIIINAPLSDENGVELSLNFAENTFAGIMLMVKNDYAEIIRARVESAGVGVVGKPVPVAEVMRFLRLLLSVHQRFMGMKRENNLLKNKLEEIRTVDRAKLVLIDALHMTENQAHKFIEKQAMDLRMTRKAVAEQIIKTYER